MALDDENLASSGVEVTTPIDQSVFPAVSHLVVLRPAEGGHGPTAAHELRPVAFASLMLELMARTHRVAVVDDAPSVMVELHRGGQVVVLVDPPASSATIAELITAVTRYYPRVTLWQAHHDPHDNRPALVRIASAASVSAASQPHVLLDDLHHDTAHHAEPSANVGNFALVSDEELAMLMSPMNQEDEH